ncbi:uncharacterized protein PHACADRAFT_253191 [Phanerochaete carnosa HHB-10118-sp]|uniref:Zn(2)-C6 fungal-type domain-containing protein n=1 Tax=Phanerochaete carnosa (strain HHB-10118-sp) TaxID=650164 RepID=K5WH92_PHACS|nr:uncharacterized protein PHACADRAFT_253191 [Phanerochaete carnosa HHB-10118-sp]EKM58700.1 hypothetical protein PHACADRAFT_253191 [Phanerochaete carnosa HHB-10118-sp]
MSDRDEDELSTKKRRSRACDQCRKRKVRCDGSEEEGKSCSTCAAFKSKCTYTATTEMRKKRYVEDEYVRALESEVMKLRLTVRQLQSRLTELERPHVAIASTTSSPTFSDPPPTIDISVKQEETGEDEGLVEGLKYMILDERRVHFMGRSSSFPLMKAAMKMKQELVKDNTSPLLNGGYHPLMPSKRRPEFWISTMDFIPPELPYTDFPEPSLMNDLLDNYFQKIHRNFPLLHRPTFLQNIASGLHLIDEGFGATVLLVCALGARFSYNPAALMPGLTSWHWAGWRWFQQVRAMRKLIPLTMTTLYDLQVAALAGAYVAVLSMPQSNYAIMGYAVRLAQDLGAHRRVAYEPEPTVEGELRKRAFWCLLVMDRGACSNLGRPCDVKDEDFDIGYPIECDDEYWVTDDPQRAFKQPVGQPSTVAYFNCALKLERIHVHTLRTIYSPQGAKSLSDPERAQQIVAELDSELNQWVDSIPEHLRYDPNREDVPFAGQSASLHASYHSLRIFIHRPFIMTPRRHVPLPFPSLAICTNAARSCIQVLDRYFTLSGQALVFRYHLTSLFSSVIILLLHVWSETQSGSTTDVTKELEYVHKALRIFKDLEERWNVAGQFWDIIHDLMTAVEATQNGSACGVHEHRQDDDIVPAHDVYLTSQMPVQQPSADVPPTYDNDVQQQLRTVADLPDYPQANLDYAPPPRVDGSSRPSRLPNSQSPGSNSFWHDLQAQQEMDAQGQFGPLPPLNSACTPDPDLDAIFADLLPSLSHEGPFAAMARGMPHNFAPGQLFGRAGGGVPEGQPYEHSGGFMDTRFVSPGMPSVWGAGTQGSSL